MFDETRIAVINYRTENIQKGIINDMLGFICGHEKSHNDDGTEKYLLTKDKVDVELLQRFKTITDDSISLSDSGVTKEDDEGNVSLSLNMKKS